jgi:hypothetical protein
VNRPQVTGKVTGKTTNNRGSVRPCNLRRALLIRIKLEQERTKKTESLIYLSVSSVAARKD